jgi:hypothetical protein
MEWPKEAFMTMDAWSNANDMSASSEGHRRIGAELVQAIDMDPSVDASTTHDAVCRYVDQLATEGELPEAVVIAFKATLAESHSLQRFDPDVREAIRAALVSACIHRYFTRTDAADVPITQGRTLRLVRDVVEPRGHATSPDASA